MSCTQEDNINAAVKQVALADLILLNKIDLMSSREEIDSVSSVVRNINSLAKLEQTKMSKVNLDMVLDLHAYDGNDVIPEQFDTPVMTHLDSNVGTVTLRYNGFTEFNKVEMFLQKLLWERDEFKNAMGYYMEIMRLKANVILDNGKRQVLIQGVHDTYDTYERPNINASKTLEENNRATIQSNKIESGCIFVLIGKYLDYDILQKALSMYLS